MTGEWIPEEGMPSGSLREERSMERVEPSIVWPWMEMLCRGSSLELATVRGLERKEDCPPKESVVVTRSRREEPTRD